jgi:hypothetical protein
LQEEEAFLDTLRENLELCRVLLLIVGDRDLLRVQDLAKDLQHGFALMHFTLAIAELNLYEFDERSVLVVPRVLARTKEIPRTVATIKGGPPLSYPTAESVMAAESLDRPARVNISQTDFERQLVANGHTAAVSTVMDLLRFFSKQPDLVVEPKSASQSVRYVGPASQGRPLSILFLDTKHGANFDYLWSKVRGAGLPEAIAIRCWESIATGYGTGFTTRTPGTKHAAEPPPPKVVPYRLLVEKPEVLRDSVQRLVDEIREAEPDPEREIRWQK